MATSFPGAKDNFPDPIASTATNAPGFSHAGQHDNANDAITAIEDVILNGTGFPIALVRKADALGGDASGNPLSPTITGIQGRSVSSTAPTLNQVYAWNGTAWAPLSTVSTNHAASTVTGPDAYGASSAVGTSLNYAREDHDHGLPSAPADLPLVGGTMSGAIAMGSNKITGLANGTAAQDAAAFGQIPTASSTQTLTNKRVQPRLVTVTQSATPATNTDNGDIFTITGLAQAITSMTTNLTGTPVDGEKIEFRITDNGTARAITWGASFAATTVALPTTTVASTRLRVSFEWDSTASVWACIGSA